MCYVIRLKKLGKFKAIETYDQLKRERSSALLFIRQLKESGFKHDLETYIAVVRLLCHWDWGIDARSDNLINDVIDNTNWEVINFEIFHDLFDALLEEKLIKVVDGLVEVYASAGRFEGAIHTLSEMKSRGGLVVSTRTSNFVMWELIKQDKEDMVESVIRELKRNGMIPDEFTYGILMREICKKGCLEEAWNVIEEMKEAGVDPNALIYSMYIHGLCRKGKTDLAFQLVKNLRKSNKPVKTLAYSCIIRGFVKESKLQDAEDVLLDMKLREVVPDEYCYVVLILAFCEKGDIDNVGIEVQLLMSGSHQVWFTLTDKALDLCKEMESRAIKTDHKFVSNQGFSLMGVSFKIVIDAACKLGKMDDAMGLLEEMKGRKIKASCYACTSRYQLTRIHGQWVQPNVGPDEGDEGVQDVGVQTDEGVHKGVVRDARNRAGVGYVEQLHTTQQNLALHKLTSLDTHHDVVLKKFTR
ncbi:unnamed protein product [Lactuca virosa]|uniref:Pentacotripeptide-repeat region of PRORP domain-containing protein n=1 Tax=Lactuca virosa TaxID=75947 RepID=A0AAU9NW51_9ASTR|nr:unnamed protein product [Lactuca virosa]